MGTCVQDMKSCPSAVESSKIHNGFDMAGSWFQTRQPSLSHTCSIGLSPATSSAVEDQRYSVFFVFLNDVSTVRSCNAISEYHVLAIKRVQV